ncbi:MAG: outer membrane lipoprotein-sorting protein [Mariprofundaceae bacterium]|nr:outer membrane lipoprotein-sorting protein [Mariprofundaceae bacterium]
MIRQTPVLLLLVLLIPLQAAAGEVAGDVTSGEARETMIRLQKLLRSDTNLARYTMTVKTPEWTRSITMDSWDDRPGKRFFIRIVAPKKDRSTTYLKLGPNLWMYLPKLERDIRIPPSMMLSSWMGSDFTNDDLVKTASVVDDYHHRITAGDGESITIESIPKEDAPVVWGKLVHVIRSDGIPLSEDFYDEHGKKRRSLKFDTVREVGGRTIPTRWVMQPLDKPDKETVLQIDSIEFDPPIADSVFTRANLKRRPT